MCAGGGLDDVRDLGIVHFSDGIGERARCVHNNLRPDVKRLAVSVGIKACHSSNLSFLVFRECGHLDIVNRAGSSSLGSERNQQRHPRIILRSVVVHPGSLEPLRFELGKSVKGLAYAAPVRRRVRIVFPELVVLGQQLPKLRHLPLGVTRHHNRHGLHQIRRTVVQILLLHQPVLHHLELLLRPRGIRDKCLQVPHPAMVHVGAF